MAIHDPSTPNEIWYPVPSLPGYQVSSDFNVRTSWHLDHNRRLVMDLLPGVWRPLKVRYPSRGYPYFCAYKAGPRGLISVTAQIHRIIAQIIYGPVPDGLFVLHYDDDGENMNASNLRYGTRSDNCADTRRNKAKKRREEGLRKTTGFVPDWTWSERRGYRDSAVLNDNP